MHREQTDNDSRQTIRADRQTLRRQTIRVDKESEYTDMGETGTQVLETGTQVLETGTQVPETGTQVPERDTQPETLTECLFVGTVSAQRPGRAASLAKQSTACALPDTHARCTGSILTPFSVSQ